MAICKKIWSAKCPIRAISYFRDIQLVLIVKQIFGKEASNDSQQHLNGFFIFLFYVSLLLNTMKAAAEAVDGISHFVHCDVERDTVVGIMGPGLRFHPSAWHIAADSFAASPSCLQNHCCGSRYFFSCSDCFDMEKTPEWSLSLLQAPSPAVRQFPA